MKPSKNYKDYYKALLSNALASPEKWYRTVHSGYEYYEVIYNYKVEPETPTRISFTYSNFVFFLFFIMVYIDGCYNFNLKITFKQFLKIRKIKKFLDKKQIEDIEKDLIDKALVAYTANINERC